MAKRPNAMGRIEGDPKPEKKKFNWKATFTVIVALLLVLVGVSGTLRYQAFIEDVKSEGVAEYKLTCNKFTDDDKELTWLECDNEYFEVQAEKVNVNIEDGTVILTGVDLGEVVSEVGYEALLQEMDYSDIVAYVNEVEQDKADEEFDRRSDR